MKSKTFYIGEGGRGRGRGLKALNFIRINVQDDRIDAWVKKNVGGYKFSSGAQFYKIWLIYYFIF